MRRIFALSVVAALLLAGCGGDGDEGGGLDRVEVSKGETPALTTGEDLSVEDTETRTISEGDGDEVAEGDVVQLDYIAVNGRTGKEFDNTFKGGSPMTVTIKSQSVLEGFVEGLTGAKVGSRLLVAVPPEDGFQGANEQLELQADDTMVFLFDVVSKVPEQAAGDAKDVPDRVPSLVLNEDDQPTEFEATDDTGDAPSELGVHTVLEGDGPEVEAGQTMTIQYVGQIYPEGKVFDESWSRGPATFQIGAGQLIPCWDEGLVGQKVGSRVILECPPDFGYGENGNADAGIDGTDTLLFAVDLLASF